MMMARQLEVHYSSISERKDVSKSIDSLIIKLVLYIAAESIAKPEQADLVADNMFFAFS